MADGDGRFLLNLVEEIARLPSSAPLGPGELARLVQQRAPLYDKAQEGHYNLISALHKSLRGSDTDAALYWLARMLAGGEDPIYILRRLTRAAVEDIGLADPQAVIQALSAWDAYDRLGSPEGELAIAQCVIYLATAPKSNAAYTAFGEARQMARETGSLMPPLHILNAPTRLMRDLGYGRGYVYDHATEEAFLRPELFPGRDRAPHLLPAGRTRFRARGQKAPRLLGKAARARGRNSSHDRHRRNRNRRRRRWAASPRSLVQAALPGAGPWPARKAAAHRADPGRRQARQGRRPAGLGPGDPHPAARCDAAHRPRRRRAGCCRPTRRCCKGRCCTATRRSSSSTSRRGLRSRAGPSPSAISTGFWTACALAVPNGRGSSIASTRIPAACWSSPAAPRRPRS